MGLEMSFTLDFRKQKKGRMVLDQANRKRGSSTVLHFRVKNCFTESVDEGGNHYPTAVASFFWSFLTGFEKFRVSSLPVLTKYTFHGLKLGLVKLSSFIDSHDFQLTRWNAHFVSGLY